MNCILFHVNRRLYNSKNNKKFYIEKRKTTIQTIAFYISTAKRISKKPLNPTQKKNLCYNSSRSKTAQSKRYKISDTQLKRCKVKFLKSNRKILCLPNHKTRKKKNTLPLFARLQPGHFFVNKTSWRIYLAQQNS